MKLYGIKNRNFQFSGFFYTIWYKKIPDIFSAPDFFIPKWYKIFIPYGIKKSLKKTLPPLTDVLPPLGQHQKNPVTAGPCLSD